jgi:lysophospholipase L1-like esterase
MFDIPMDLKSLEASIIAYEQEPIQKGKIMFYGQSFFTRWGSPKWGYRRLDEDIRMKDGSLAVVNHGFGTSTSEELLYYYDRLVRPWKPRALVLSTGNNFGYGYTAAEVAFMVSRILEWARKDFPGIRLFLEFAEPSPAGKKSPDAVKCAFKEYSQLMRAYVAEHDDVVGIDCATIPEFFQPGHVGDYDYPREELFVPDGVHYNQAGYDVYRDIYLKVLDELL